LEGYNLFFKPSSAMMTHSQPPQAIQMWVYNENRKKGTKLGHTPWFTAFRGYMGVLELRNGIRKIGKHFNHSHRPAQIKQQVD
jgi:hypothetical protein